MSKKTLGAFGVYLFGYGTGVLIGIVLASVIFIYSPHTPVREYLATPPTHAQDINNESEGYTLGYYDGRVIVVNLIDSRGRYRSESEIHRTFMHEMAHWYHDHDYDHFYDGTARLIKCE